MKGMKKLLSILMVLTLVLSLGASALATTDVTVADDGTYVAYQIFTGEYATIDGAETLGNIGWGEGIDPTSFVDALKKIDVTAFGTLTIDDPAAVATAIAQNKSFGTQVADAAFAAKKGDGKSISKGDNELDDGYYLIVNTEAGADGVFNHALLQLAGTEIEIKAKADGPKFDKYVKDINDTDGQGETNWQKSGDWDIGDPVPFKLEATTPTKGEGYDSYKMVFHDKMCEGLTLDADSFVITADGTEINKENYESLGISINTTTPIADGCTFEITIDNVMAEGILGTDWLNKTITVEYKATLNEGCIIGNDGNTNEAKLQFSNNPNAEGTGDTPWKKVVVFTYDLDVNKVDGDGEHLDGAEFALYKKVPAGTAEAVQLLKDGSPAKGGESADKFLNEDNTAYYIVSPNNLKMDATSKWLFTAEGLDDGDYVIVETETPAGYNTADPIQFTLTADHSANDGETKTNVTSPTVEQKFTVEMNPADDEAIIDTNVVNNQGATLPETGGIGTTIFYIAGAILVAGAVIILVTKKRVSGAEK